MTALARRLGAALAVLIALPFGAQAAHAAPGDSTQIAVPTAGSRPHSIARGADGSLWLTETAAGKIARVNASGTVTEFALPAGAQPADLVHGRDASLWYADGARPAIGRLTAEGVSADVGLLAPEDRVGALAVGADGGIWYSLSNRPAIGKVRADGGGIDQIDLTAPFSSVADIVLGPDAHIWLADPVSGSLGVVGDDGSVKAVPLGEASAPIGAVSLATGADGRIWFADKTGRIGSSDLNGGLRWTDPRSTGVTASTVALGPDARIWFVDTEHHKVGTVTDSGELAVVTASEAMTTPTAIAVGAGNTLWVTDGAGSVWKLETPLAIAEQPDDSRTMLLVLGVGLAVLIGLIVLLVLIVRSRPAKRPREEDFMSQLGRTPPSKIDPPADRGAAVAHYWTRAGRRLFADAGRDGAIDLSRFLAFVALAAFVFLPELLPIPEAIAPLFVPAIFTVLAVGVGMSSQRAAARGIRAEGIPALQAMTGLLARSIVLLIIGGVATVTGKPYSGLLLVLAGLLLVTAPFLHVRRSRVVLTAVIGIVVAPVILYAAAYAAVRWPESAPYLTPLMLQSPLAILLPLIPATLAGVVVERVRSTDMRSGAAMIGVGAGMVLVGYGVAFGSTFLYERVGIDLVNLGRPAEYTGPWLPELLGLDRSAPSPFLLLGGIGAAFALIGLFRLTWAGIRWPLFPAVASGALALTGYVVAMFAMIVPEVRSGLTDLRTALIVLAVAVVVATLWRLLLPAGPLEALVQTVGRRSAALVRIPAGASAHAREREAAVKRRVRSNWTAEGRTPTSTGRTTVVAKRA